MRARFLVPTLIMSMFALSCRSAHQDNSTEGSKAEQARPIPRSIPAQDPASTLPPSVCRVIATVLGIDSTLSVGAANDPCAKAPCHATVRIDSILGYGSAFPYPLSPGQVVRTTFTFTLAPTATILPSVNPQYPGLVNGSRFKADLEATPTPGQTSGDQTFVVGGYEVR